MADNSDTPRTIGDEVRADSILPDEGGTGQGLKLLDLLGTQHYSAANKYLAALAIIRQLEAKLASYQQAMPEEPKTVAFLIKRALLTPTELVLSPLTDDVYLPEGDEAVALVTLENYDTLARAYAALKWENRENRHYKALWEEAADKRDELQAKLAACEVERDCARGNNVLFNEQNLRLTDRIIALEAKLAACEKDAELYRYCRQNPAGLFDLVNKIIYTTKDLKLRHDIAEQFDALISAAPKEPDHG